MLDLKLMYQLLGALPAQAQLILLGDRDQLASVAAGNVLGDITGHGQNPDSAGKALGHDAAALDLLKAGVRGLRWFDVDSENLHGDALRWLYDAYQPIFESDSPAQALLIYEKTRLLCATS